MRIHKTSRWIAAMSTIGFAVVLSGCRTDQGAAPDKNPGDTARTAAANIDKQIEKMKNDPNVPADAKQRAIEGMERGKAMAEAAAAGAKAPAGSGTQ